MGGSPPWDLTLAFDILTAIGLGAACGIRPFLPVLVAGGLAAANATIDFDHTRLRVPRGALVAARVTAAFVVTILAAKLDPAVRPLGGEPRHRRPARRGHARRTTTTARRSAGCSACCSPCSPRLRRATSSGACARRLDEQAAGALPLYARGRRADRRRRCRARAAAVAVVVALPRLAAAGRPPALRREVRRPARAAVKLVLAVVDGMKPAMVRRAVETGQAPVMAKVMERGTFVSDCVAAFPSVTPVCATSIATGARQDVHHIPAMNWFWRDERRYVEYGSSMRAARRFGIGQQLTDLIYTMNGEHLSPRGADDLRGARRRRRAHRRHDVPDLPRAPRARGVAGDGAVAGARRPRSSGP